MNAEATNLPKILLIDDEGSVLFALRLLLQALGYGVADFSSPEAALEFAKSDTTCDLCICDLRMPSMTGIEVLVAIKKLRPDLPFVLMSAHAGSDEMALATAQGANGFLSKPFTPDDLLEQVRLLGLIANISGA